MSEKVVIVVEGGNVQTIYTARADIEVVVIDHDNLRETLTKSQRDELEEREAAGLTPIAGTYPDAL
jgi:hypothetical protein